MSGIKYTEDQIRWFRENWDNYSTYKKLQEAYHQSFPQENRSIQSLMDLCRKRMNLPRNKVNEGKFGSRKSVRDLPIGTVRYVRYGCNIYPYIKVAKVVGSNRISGYQEPFWLPLQKKIWMDAYGDVPEGYMVAFADGDPKNLMLDNLVLVSRSISAAMATRGWYTGNKELTKTAIKCIELEQLLKKERAI